MGSSAILRRWIYRSRAAGMVRSLRNYSSTGTFMSVDSCSGRESGANRVMSGVSSDESPSPPSISPPWLMLPPVLKGGAFNLNKVKPDESPDGDAEVVGSSHGWVALFNRRNNDLFLSHPLSHRHIKLPPIHTLPDPGLNLDLDGHGSVSKVILSSSPDDEECRAMMTFGPAKRLAFCLPGRSSEWTPIGELFIDSSEPSWVMFTRVHDDLVYRSRRKVFTSITPCNLDFTGFFLDDRRVLYSFLSESYNWDIQNPASPKMVRSGSVKGWKEDKNGNGNKELDAGVPRGRTRIWWEENKEFLEKQCIHIPHLVYAEQSDQLFLVLRFVMLMNSDDGGGGGSPLGYIPRCVVKGLSDVFPCKTFGFIIMEMDDEEICMEDYDNVNGCTVVEDLNGMSMFVGINHSFAISSSELKPNSIYFTDAKRIGMVSGDDDTGIFDYENKTVSPLCTAYDSPTSSFDASPLWFTPNR